jgi:hypothetical protein
MRRHSAESKPAGLGADVSGWPAGAARGDQVHRASNRVRSVQRRARSAKHFDPVEIGDEELTDKRGRVALWRRRVTEADAIDQERRILLAQAAQFHRRERAESPELLNGDSRHSAQCVADGKLIPCRDLCRVDNRDGFRHLRRCLKMTGARNDDVLDHRSQVERHGDRPRRVSANRDRARSGREAGRVDVDDIRAR